MIGLLLLFTYAYALLVAGIVFAIVWGMNRPRRKTLGVSLGLGGPGDPADLGLEAQEATFNLSDGTSSPGWVVAGDRPQGLVAVVVHGHRDSRFGALYRAEMLKPHVRATVVFDLPGHGDAAAPRCLMGRREADDVHAVVDGLPSALADAGVVLLGYSMGATIAVKAAAQRPGRFVGVVACAPYRRWDGGLRGQMRKHRLPAFPAVSLAGALLRLIPGLGETPGFDRAADAARVPCPLLVLHGDADIICALDDGRAIAEAAPRGELVVIPGGQHNQLLGAGYETMHAGLARFFATV